MPVAPGDIVTPAGSFNGNAGVANLAVGTLCPDGLTLGVFEGGAIFVRWNTGFNESGTTFTAGNLRVCTAYTGSDLLGKTVRLLGKGPAFQGTVVQQLNTELDDTDGDGTQTPVVVVKTERFTYVAEPASLEEV